MSISKNVFRLNKIYELVNAGLIDYTGAIDEPASLWSWGFNNTGEAGDNTTIPKSSPVQIPGTEWTKIGNNSYSGGIKSDGSAWVWGPAGGGRLGLNNLIDRSSPVQLPGNWKCVSINGTGFGIKNDNTLWSWGANYIGQLGQNNTIYRSSPIQIPGAWCQVANFFNKSAAIKTDGTLWVWGTNARAALGVNDTTHRSSPTQIPGTQWVDIRTDAGYGHMIARKSDGTAWSWGQNFYGQLGHSNRLHRSSPVQIPGTNWANMVVSNNMSMGRRTDGTLWSWGYPLFGQLGLNLPGTQPAASGVSVSSPTQIPGTNWIVVDVNPSGALKSDGTLWTWGGGYAGSLGDGTTINRSSPIQIPGIWKEYHGRSRARR